MLQKYKYTKTFNPISFEEAFLSERAWSFAESKRSENKNRMSEAAGLSECTPKRKWD
jgi:hypothetical protein